MQMYWFVIIDMLGGASGLDLRLGKDTPQEEHVGGQATHLFESNGRQSILLIQGSIFFALSPS